MNDTPASAIAYRYRQTHDRVLALVADLAGDQLGWRPASGVHSVAWNLWHLARWADHLYESLPRMTPELGARLGPNPQIWAAEGLAETWGMVASELGFEATGSLMADEAAERLTVPSKEALIAYARRAFAAADGAVATLDDALLSEPDATAAAFNAAYHGADKSAPVASIADAVLEHLTHDNRHLGEIECLLAQLRAN